MPMLKEAASQATHGNCFDLHGYLPDLYSKFGLNPVARVKFDPAQAPAGWDEKTMDAPDIVMLAKGDTGVDMSKGYEAVKDKIPVRSYDEARQSQERFAKAASINKERESERKWIEAQARDAAEKFGFAGKVDAVDEPPRYFKVGSKEFREAAHYQPSDGSIQLNARTMESGEQVDAIMAHETMHHKFHVVKSELEREHTEAMKVWNEPNDQWKRLWRVSGEPRDEAARAEIEKRWPVSAIYGKTWGDSIAEFGGDRKKMEASDGVSDYSKAYWKSDRDYDIKINETLAEIARLDHTGELKHISSSWKNSGWMKLYNGINEQYDRLKDKSVPSTTEPVVKEGMTLREQNYLADFKREQRKFVKTTGKLGLRYDADLTGEPLPEKDLAEHLAIVGKYQHDTMLRHGGAEKGVKYGGTSDYLQHEGEWFDLPDKPPQIRLMTPKECYSNAAQLAMDHPDKYDYVEGAYASNHLPMPIDHAWLVDKKTGKVVDPTLGWQPTSRYFGVAYPRSFLIKKIRQNKYYGLHSDGNMVSDLVLGRDKDFKYGQRDNSNNK